MLIEWGRYDQVVWPCSGDDTIAKRFSDINDSFWKRLEKKELTKIEVQRGRFIQLFDELKISSTY